MGLGGISIWQLLIVLGIVVMIFGTKKLRNLGGDLGSAVKGFKSAMKDGEAQAAQEEQQANLTQAKQDEAIDVTASKVKEEDKV